MNNNEQVKHETTQSESDNNDWIKINSEDDLPKEDGYYWTVDKSEVVEPVFFVKNKQCFYVIGEEWLIDWSEFTHYKPLKKPNKPLF